MYKLLLCWRYLLTRFIALASVASVTLGVAAMIVVNAVMLGFTSEMEDRTQGILGDVIFTSHDLDKGFPYYDWHRDKIFEVAGDLIEELTPTAATTGMLTYRIGGIGEPVTFQVKIVGIDAPTQAKVSKIASYLQHPENRKLLSFDLRDDGYDVQGDGSKGAYREEMRHAGWGYRRWRAAQIKQQQRHFGAQHQTEATDQPFDPFTEFQDDIPVFDMAKEQHAGIIVGIGASSLRRTSTIDPETGEKRVEDNLALLPGDDVTLGFLTADWPPRVGSDNFTVVDLYESKMYQYDQGFAFVPIEKLQQLRGMVDPDSGSFTVTHILIKAKPGVDLNLLRDRLRKELPRTRYSITTWQDDTKQMLDAFATELAMINVLLFLIFAVAGFGILAIFYMIVIEKQKDIGILKALGASSWGVLQIFLYYSLLLGSIGSGLGLVAGLLFVEHIKEIAVFLGYILQRDIFSPEVYSFYEIPTVVDVPTVVGIIAGALCIAVAAGVLPAMRAARVHPVETLRS
jgi:lipoprotein-releasing system permease protein